MRKSGIKLHGMYSDGKGNVREIIDEGEHCKLYKTVEETDNVRYRVARKGRRQAMSVGDEGNMTRTQFARWAKFASDVDGEETDK